MMNIDDLLTLNAEKPNISMKKLIKSHKNMNV